MYIRKQKARAKDKDTCNCYCDFYKIQQIETKDKQVSNLCPSLPNTDGMAMRDTFIETCAPKSDVYYKIVTRHKQQLASRKHMCTTYI